MGKKEWNGKIEMRTSKKGEDRVQSPIRRTKRTKSRFSLRKNPLNNKLVVGMLVLLLLFLNLFLFTRVSFLFEPLSIVLSIIGPPIIVSGIFYYLLNPLINRIESKGYSRTIGIVLVAILLILLIVWGVAVLIPILRAQFTSLIENWPLYWETIIREVEDFLQSDTLSILPEQLRESDLLSTITDYLTTILTATVGGITNIIGTMTQVLVVIFTTPFIVYYLLKDGHHLPEYLIRFVPLRMRDKFLEVGSEANTQISHYVRGQLIVAFFVGLLFWIGFSMIGLEYALSLGVLSGVLNLIPYLGSILATIPAIIIGLVHSPFMLVKVLIVFSIEQIIEGRVLSPQILGSNLKVHPITIIFILLVAGRLFGVAGVILGIPGYAVIKIFLKHFFIWYQDVSGWYEDGNVKETSQVETSDS